MGENFCDNCAYRGRPSYVDPCALCNGGENWEEEKDESEERE